MLSLLVFVIRIGCEVEAPAARVSSARKGVIPRLIMSAGDAVGGGGVAAGSCAEAPGVRACATRRAVSFDESVRPVVPAAVAPEAKKSVAQTAGASVGFRIVRTRSEPLDGG